MEEANSSSVSTWSSIFSILLYSTSHCKDLNNILDSLVSELVMILLFFLTIFLDSGLGFPTHCCYLIRHWLPQLVSVLCFEKLQFAFNSSYLWQYSNRCNPGIPVVITKYPSDHSLSLIQILWTDTLQWHRPIRNYFGK